MNSSQSGVLSCEAPKA